MLKIFSEQFSFILWSFRSDCHFWAITVLGCIWSKSKLASNASVNSSCAQPPWATAGYLLALSVPGVGHLQILHFPGARHLPTPSFWHAPQFPIRILLHRGFYLKNKQIGSFVKDGKILKRFVKAWSRFYACISSLLIKPELQSETRELSTWIDVFWVIESSFSWYY